MTATRPSVLFLCTGNSCRSQMAEGFARSLHGDRLRAASAGTEPHGLNPRAVQVMSEVGIDISGHESTSISAFDPAILDLVVTVCDSASESCPTLPGTTVVHRSFEDPPRLAEHAAGDEEALSHYRRVRDEIRSFIETLPALLDAARASTT